MEWTHWALISLAVYVFGLHVFLGDGIAKLSDRIRTLENEIAVSKLPPSVRETINGLNAPRSPSDETPQQPASPDAR